MSEEVKQEKQPEEVQADENASAQTAEEKAPESGSAATGEKKAPPKVEIPKNCGACKKPIRKIRYYRNMQFFCNRKCWEKFKKTQEVAKKKAEAEQQQAQEQAQ